jgi:hypothetical protein
MFKTSLDLSSVTFAGSLCSFVANCCYDDSRFQIHWNKPDYHNMDIEYVPTTKDDPDGMPEIIRNGDGFWQAELLLEAMDIFEKRRLQRDKWIEEEMNLPFESNQE